MTTDIIEDYNNELKELFNDILLELELIKNGNLEKGKKDQVK